MRPHKTQFTNKQHREIETNTYERKNSGATEGSIKWDSKSRVRAQSKFLEIPHVVLLTNYL